MVNGSRQVQLTQPRNVKAEIVVADFFTATTLWLFSVPDIKTSMPRRARL